MQYDWDAISRLARYDVGRSVAADRRTSGGLAAQIVRLTLIVGVATVLASATVAIVSTSRLSAEKADSRGLLAVQRVEDGVETRLGESKLVMERVSEIAATTTETAAVRRNVQTALVAGDALFEDVYVAEGRNGLVLASLPSGERLSSVRRLPAFAEVRQGRGGFFSYAAAPGDVHELWFARTTVTSAGRPVVVLARLDLQFLDDLLAGVARGASGRVVEIMDGDGTVATGDPSNPLMLAEAQWRATTGSSGRVTAQGRGGEVYEGLYDDMQSIEGITWRVLVLESAETVLGDTLRAVGPSIAVLAVGGLIAVLAAWVITQRLVQPLRELERTALSAAAGSYVRPLSAERDDEIGRVAEAFNAVALRLNALHDLSQLLASASQLDQVLDGILSSVGHIVGPGAAAIYLLDSSGTSLVPARTRGIDLAHAQAVDLTDGGWLADALHSTDPRDLEGEQGELAAAIPGLEGAHTAALAAPLVVGSHPLGVVVVLRDNARPVSEAEREMVRTFSAQAAVAVNTSRLFREESESRQISEALRAVAEELVRPEGLDEALTNVEAIARAVLGAVVVKIIVIDRAVVGLGPHPEALHQSELLGVGLHALSLGSGLAISVPVGDDHSVDVVLREYDAVELLVVPISLDSEHGAVMMVGLGEHDGGSESLLVAQALADEIALALDNAYFFERAVTRAENLETIFRISQAVGSSLQVKVVLNRVLDVVQKILSADAVALLLYDPRKRSLTTAMARGQVPPSVLHLDVQPGVDVPGHVFSSGEPVAIRDLHAGMDGVAGAAAGNDLGSLLAVPMLARGRSIGVLMVFSGQRGAFSDEDLNVLRTFASQAALSLDTARLYSREHEVATVLQQSILPDALPEFPEIMSASVYAPAGEDTEIGGDYYDLFRAPDDAIWFAIADVAGKGVEAATKTSMIKYAVRAFVAAGLGPGRVLSEVNRMTTEAGDPSDIVTAWLGRLDTATGLLRWANGGHPPGLLKRADGSFERLATTGPLLGAIVEVEYHEESIELGINDEVLLYTDGVTEARRGNVFFGEDRVRESFARSKDALDAARDLLESVRGFVQAELRDDIAVLVIGVRSGRGE